jgi:hypothetical protein
MCLLLKNIVVKDILLPFVDAMMKEAQLKKLKYGD